MQDVTTFLARKGLSFPGYLNPDLPAIIDADHAIRVNYETYVFAELDAVDKFYADPVLYCGLVTDPVTKERFRPRADAARYDYGGVLYFFDSEESFDAFVLDPETYRLPGWVMPEPMPTDESETDEAEQE